MEKDKNTEKLKKIIRAYKAPENIGSATFYLVASSKLSPVVEKLLGCLGVIFLIAAFLPGFPASLILWGLGLLIVAMFFIDTIMGIFFRPFFARFAKYFSSQSNYDKMMEYTKEKAYKDLTEFNLGDLKSDHQETAGLIAEVQNIIASHEKKQRTPD